MSQRLPTNPFLRISEAVRRSLPSARVAAVDLPVPAIHQVCEARNRRAVMYAEMEDVADRFRRQAEAAEASGIVLDVVGDDDEDSLVTSIDRLEESLEDAPVKLRAAGASHG